MVILYLYFSRIWTIDRDRSGCLYGWLSMFVWLYDGEDPVILYGLLWGLWIVGDEVTIDEIDR